MLASRSLAKELTLVVLVKLILLTTLWYVCFSNPIAPQITSKSIHQHLFQSKLTS